MLQVEEGVLEELLKAESLLGVRLEAADEEVAARLGQFPAAGDDDGLPLLDLDQHLEEGESYQSVHNMQSDQNTAPLQWSPTCRGPCRRGPRRG